MTFDLLGKKACDGAGDVASLAGSAGCSNTRAAGNRVKVRRKATAIPIAIIQPKSIIGRISLTSNEPNATIVVIAVYKQGRLFDFTVSMTRIR